MPVAVEADILAVVDIQVVEAEAITLALQPLEEALKHKVALAQLVHPDLLAVLDNLANPVDLVNPVDPDNPDNLVPQASLNNKLLLPLPAQSALEVNLVLPDHLAVLEIQVPMDNPAHLHQMVEPEHLVHQDHPVMLVPLDNLATLDLLDNPVHLDMQAHLPLDPKDLPAQPANLVNLATLVLVVVKVHPDHLAQVDLLVLLAVLANLVAPALLVTMDNLVVMENTVHALVVVVVEVADLLVDSVLA